MIRKIIFRRRKPLQLIASFTGALAGFILLLVSVQFYGDIRNILTTKDELLGEDYLVISKSISGTSTIMGSQPLFSDSELQKIRDQKFVREIGEFVPGRFSLFVYFPALGGEQGMQTFAFVEAVEDRFIDVKTKKWEWSEGGTEIPVILPSSYMDSYNFGFAPGLGLPPVSESVFKKMKLMIQIEGNNKKAQYTGNIAGFSDRINTILVPMKFVNYANGIFHNRKEENPARLILAVTDIHDPDLAKFLEDQGYQTNEDNLRGSRVKSVLQVTMSVFFILGMIILLLSVHSFVQYSQIIISEVSYELKVMMVLGYTASYLARKYMFFYWQIVGIITVLAGTGMIIIKKIADSYLETYNLTGSDHVLSSSWVTGILFAALMILTTSGSIYLQVRRLAKNLQSSGRG